MEPSRVWEGFEATLAQLRRLLARDSGVPSIGVKMGLRPGRYWFFSPHAYNVVQWWCELLLCQGSARRRLVDAWAVHMHQEFAEHVGAAPEHLAGTRVAPQMRRGPVPPQMTRRAAELRRERDADLLSLGAELFSFREKIAWLVFELLSTHRPLSIPRHRVGFSTIQRAVGRLARGRLSDADGAVLEGAFRRLDSADCRALIAFRHGLTHSMRPRLDQTPSLRMVQSDDETWDSVSPTPVYARHILHSATWMWATCVRTLREIASLEALSHLAFLVRPESRAQSNLPIYIHQGMQLRVGGLPGGERRVTVRCMKRCEGVRGEMAVDTQTLSPAEQEVCFQALSAALSRVVTAYDMESRGARALQYSGPDALYILLIRDVVDARTVAEVAFDIAAKDMEEREFRWVALEDVDLKDVVSFAGWPEEARTVLRGMMQGENPHVPIVFRGDVRAPVALCRLIFKPPPRDLIVKGERIAGPDVSGGSPLAIHTWAEPALRSARAVDDHR